MLTNDRIIIVFRLAVPACISLTSSLAVSLIILAMVGRLGTTATAAVGLSVSINAAVLALMGGLTPAIQGLVARRRGEGVTDAAALPLNGGLVIALGAGTLLTLGCCVFSRVLFSLLSSDPEVAKIGIPFFKILSLSVVAQGLNYAFEGYWLGAEKPQIPMLIVFGTDSVNICLNYMLIFGRWGAPALGAAGAAVGTTLCVYGGLAINCLISRGQGGRMRAIPTLAVVESIAKLGLPPTLQNVVMEASYVAFFGMIGSVGTAELAASNVIVRITLLFVFFAMSLGSASATLAAKALGQDDPAAAAQWGWDTGKLAVMGISLLGMPLVLFPHLFVSIFLSDPPTISIAILPLRLVAGTAGVVSLLYVFASTLYSVGDGSRVTIVSFVTTWILCLPGVWVVGPYLKYGLLQITLVQVLSTAIAAALVTSFWADGKWKSVEV